MDELHKLKNQVQALQLEVGLMQKRGEVITISEVGSNAVTFTSALEDAGTEYMRKTGYKDFRRGLTVRFIEMNSYFEHGTYYRDYVFEVCPREKKEDE